MVKEISTDGLGEFCGFVASVEPLFEGIFWHRLAVNSRKAPIKTGLVLVMSRAVFGELAVAIRSTYRMQKRPEVRPGVLRHNGFCTIGPVNGDGPGLIVLLDSQLRWAGRSGVS